MLTPARPSRRGFTLIELLVVISIMAILIALIVPAVMRVRASATRAQAKSEISNIQMAASQFSSATSFGAGYPLLSVTPSVTHKSGKFRLATSYLDPSTGKPLEEDVEYIDPADGKKKIQRRVWPEAQFFAQVFPNINWGDNGLRVRQVFTQNPSESGGSEAVYYGLTEVDGGKKVWPTKTPPAGWLPVYEMDGNQTLFFWLMGGTATEFRGFSTNSQRPLTPIDPKVPDEKRKGPFMELNVKRFSNEQGVIDGRLRDPWGTPVVVFGALKTGKGTYSPEVTAYNYLDRANVVAPYFTANGYFNGAGVQVISAGPDRRFGAGGNYTAGSGEWSTTGPGGDDLSNFRPNQLAVGD